MDEQNDNCAQQLSNAYTNERKLCPSNVVRFVVTEKLFLTCTWRTCPKSGSGVFGVRVIRARRIFSRFTVNSRSFVSLTPATRELFIRIRKHRGTQCHCCLVWRTRVYSCAGSPRWTRRQATENVFSRDARK